MVGRPDLVGRLAWRKSTLPARRNRPEWSELLTDGGLRDALVGAPEADEEVLAFADGGDGVAGAKHRRAFMAAEDLAEDAVHFRNLPGHAHRGRPRRQACCSHCPAPE